MNIATLVHENNKGTTLATDNIYRKFINNSSYDDFRGSGQKWI